MKKFVGLVMVVVLLMLSSVAGAIEVYEIENGRTVLVVYGYWEDERLSKHRTTAKAAFYDRDAPDYFPYIALSTAFDIYYDKGIKKRWFIALEKIKGVEYPAYVGYDDTSNCMIVGMCGDTGEFLLTIYSYESDALYLYTERVYTEKEIIQVMRNTGNEYKHVTYEELNKHVSFMSYITEGLHD